MSLDKSTASPYVSRYLAIIRKNIQGLRGDMNQQQFADKVGVSRTTIQRIESGKNFEITSLLKIAEALNIFPFDLCLTEEQRRKLKEEVQVYRQTLKDEIIEEIERKHFK